MAHELVSFELVHQHGEPCTKLAYGPSQKRSKAEKNGRREQVCDGIKRVIAGVKPVIPPAFEELKDVLDVRGAFHAFTP